MKLEVFKAIVDQTMHGVIVTDATRHIIYVNRAFEISTGYKEVEVLGRNPRFLKSGKHDAIFYRNLWRQVYQYGLWQGEIWNRRKNGELFAEWQNIILIKDVQGKVTHFASFFTDITERKLKEDDLLETNIHLRNMAMSDTLTNLGNRELMNEAFRSLLYEADQKGGSFSVVMMDVDYFKQYNDLYGHIAGDQCLVEVALLLKRVLRESDVLIRYGGEEFVILLPNVGVLNASAVANKILDGIAGLQIVHEQSPYGRLSVSIGMSTYVPGTSVDQEMLLQQADQALYAAKRAGRNRYYLHAQSEGDEPFVVENQRKNQGDCR